VMVVSHDRHLIDATVDRLWLVKNGTVTSYEGDLDDYHRLILSGPPKADKKGGGNKAVVEAPIVEKSAPVKIEDKALRKRLSEVEARIAKLQADIAKIDRILGQPGYFDAHPKNAADATRVRAEREALLAQTEEDWLLLQDEIGR
jgi:ATP-binding cassette subfamily F protein 3